MLLAFPIVLALGFFLPGFFLAKYFRHALWGASAFALSLLILFHVVFWLGVFGAPLTLWTVAPCLLAASAGAAWVARGSAIPAATKDTPRLDLRDRILIASSALVGGVMLARSAVSPLIGGDTRFRWDFLAQRLLALHNFNFYPPVSPADFRTYFSLDGIPPLVSFANWWLYASAGQYLPSLICIFVAAQFACTLAFTCGAATELFSRRAGVLAAAILAASPLYFDSVVLGQETGLTALSIAAMLYFIVSARQPGVTRAMVSAGLAAALCALSREYGWIALIAGVIALLWRRHPVREIVIFGAVATAAAAPWYARNWILSGNPFYSLSFAGFPVNPVYAGILEHYKTLLGLRQWTAGTWASLLWYLLLFATLPILAGIPGAFTRFRQHGYLLVIALLLWAVWIQSAGYTSGGIAGSTRVLTPALVLLSITAAGWLESFTGRIRWHTAIVIAILLCQLWTGVNGALYPESPLALSVGQWPRSAFQRIPEATEFQIAGQLAKIVPAGSRVLSDSAYLHAALLNEGIEVVPVWSPEVRFLFSASPGESERQLQSLRIASVASYPGSLNMGYLISASPFYAALPERWHAIAQVRNDLYILAPGRR